MKSLRLIFLILIAFTNRIAAQQNWAAIPCFEMNGDAISRMMVDSLHNEIILYTTYNSSVCNTSYKGLFAYNGSGFHDLDKGVNTHNANTMTGSLLVWGCAPYNNKTVFGGMFSTVGTNTLYTKAIAVWNGAVWDTFPTRCFKNSPDNTGGGFFGFQKWNGKLWMYGGFDTIGNTITKNLTAYDGNTFTAVPPIPVTYNSAITKAIPYKNRLVVTGNFTNSNASMWRLAQFDGVNWAPVGTGVLGNIGGVWDMAVYNDTLYIGGSFSTASGNVSNYLMKWDGTQLTDAGFGNYCGFGAILNLIPFKNRLYAFGGFACAANQKAFGVAYLENGTWTVPQDSIEGNSIISAVLYNNSIYISGNFQSINGDNNINKFAKLVCPDFDAAGGCLSSISERNSKLDISVFPNPAGSALQIRFDPVQNFETIIICSALGQELVKIANPKSQQTIDLTGISPGIYFLTAKNSYGQATFKVVKE